MAVLNALETTHAVVPALWPFEVANSLALAERRRRITPEKLGTFLQRLRNLPIQVERRETLWICQATIALARKHRLTAYDAAYLDLASRDGLPLATLDQALRNAALETGVSIADW